MRSLSQYVHDKWGADRGFLGGEVHAIGQSADGYLWIGTSRGLVRFDGFEFTLIQRPLPDELPIGPVLGLVSDGDGNLWVRLEGSRMLLYSNGTFQDPSVEINLQAITFTKMARDNNGGILLAGLGDRLLRCKNRHVETVMNADQNPGTVISMAVARNGDIWLGTQDNGLFRVKDGRVSEPIEELKGARINTLLPANSGGLWIGTDHGLRLWDGKELVSQNMFSSLSKLRVLALTKDQNANIWAGTDRGIVRVSPSGTTSRSEVGSMPSNAVTAVFEDRDGDIWFGGINGIEKLRDGIFATYSVQEGLGSNAIGPIYADSAGRIWFAPRNGGLNWLDQGAVRTLTDHEIDRDTIYSIAGRNDVIWVGRQRGGLSRITPKGDSYVVRTFTTADGLADNSVYSVCVGLDGSVWVGTVSAGVSRFVGDKFTNFSEVNGLPSNAVHSILQTADGRVWVATPNGLASYAHEQWQNYSARDGLPTSDVTTVFEDSEHLLWVGTSGGLTYIKSGAVQLIASQAQVLREQILGIAEDRMGFLWIATPDHILRANRDRLRAGDISDAEIESFGTIDGLRGVEGVARDRTVIEDHQGRTWFSLNSGISVADPNITANNANPVVVRVESMTASGNVVTMQNPIQLGPGAQNIVIHYESTNLATPDRIRFRYRLDGSHEGWSDAVATRQVDYTNLGPGTYRFSVIASSSDGLWNGSATTVPFVIEPSFWQTWWFRTIALLFCLGCISAFYRLRMHQLAKQWEVRFQDRLAERTRIAQELHDTLLQGVLSASLQLDLADELLPDQSPAKNLVNRVLQMMRKVTEEGRSALRVLRVPDVDKTSLEMALARIREDLAPDLGIDYRVIVDNTARPLRPIIRDEVFRISREAVLNAFLHARATKIEVEIEYAAGHLRVLVRDDGCGIDPAVLRAGREGHWGLPGMRERSESIGAVLRLRSRLGAGTEVDLTIPAGVAYEDKVNSRLSHWLVIFRFQRIREYKDNIRRRTRR
ncbi:hypothetical protein DYQ86_04350 [Acidobacteria bacterium AB60]|nr:hypothetical protein DYQ86_04350 [Acidobacteria bacterium AB60]